MAMHSRVEQPGQFAGLIIPLPRVQISPLLLYTKVIAVGRRKRKAAIYRPTRTTPMIFECPNCGKKAMVVKKGCDEASIKCSNCLLEETFAAGPLAEPVDVYAMLVDAFGRAMNEGNQ